jgi:chemotaxis protein MotB
MAERKKAEYKSLSTPNWMTTFGDMNTLLLVFFIAMLADAAVDNRDIRLIFSNMRGSTGVLRGGNTFEKGPLSGGGGSMETLPSETAGTTIRELPSLVSSRLSGEIAKGEAKTSSERGRYKILLSSDRFFRPGSADISGPESKELLDKLASALGALGKGAAIMVTGHTDGEGIPKQSMMARIYPSDWELSSARASAVVRALSERGVDPSVLTASGRAGTEPIDVNDTP